MHVSRNNFVKIKRGDIVDRFYYAGVVEKLTSRGGHVNEEPAF